MFVLIFLLSGFVAFNAHAQLAKFESLYIYNICRYVEWPAEYSSGVFVIGLVGNNPELEASLKGIAQSKTIHNKKVIVKLLNAPAQANGCSIVFFTTGQESKIPAYLGANPNIFIFSEGPGAIYKGSDINFFAEGNKLKFELSNTNISKKPIKTSGELGQLASKVY